MVNNLNKIQTSSTALSSLFSQVNNQGAFMGNSAISFLRELKICGGESYLPKLHHFSSNSFRSSPPSFQKHYAYSINVNESERGENEQTKRRIQYAISLVKSGMTWSQAINEAWIKYPIVTR